MNAHLEMTQSDKTKVIQDKLLIYEVKISNYILQTGYTRF